MILPTLHAKRVAQMLEIVSKDSLKLCSWDDSNPLKILDKFQDCPKKLLHVQNILFLQSFVRKLTIIKFLLCPSGMDLP